MRRVAIAVAMAVLAAGSVWAADDPPWPAFATDSRIVVRVAGVRVGDVVSVEGNLVSTAIVEFRDGTDPTIVRKLPGNSTPGNIIVRRAVRTDDVLWAWYQDTLGGNAQRRDVSITYAGVNGQPTVRFDLVRCFPAAYALHAGAALFATTSVEAVTLACEGASRSAS